MVAEDTLAKINKIGLKFLESLSLKKTYSLVITEAAQLLKADWGTLYVAEKPLLTQVATYPTHLQLEIVLKKNGFIYKAYKNKETFIISEKELVTIHPELQKLEFKSAVCIPLADHKTSVGTLLLLSRHKDTFPQDMTPLKIFGAYASLAIRKAKLYDDREQALETRDFFISMAAHELRTPLTAVNGYIQLLYTKLHMQNTNEAKWIKNLLWESQRLTLLINELLEVDRIKAGELHTQWDYRNLKDILQRAITTHKFTFPKRNIQFQDDLGKDSDLIVGDFDKILQAVINVLDNAAKFSPPDTDIHLKLSANKNNLIITIQDFGVGIPKDLLPKIYEGYAVHKNNEIQGMGLGMYLVKNILRLHKGTIKIHTKENKGTTVQLLLPKA
jgi:signal transduction histidine kinase